MKKRFWVSLIAIVLVVAMSVQFVGCSAPKGDGSDSNSDSNSDNGSPVIPDVDSPEEDFIEFPVDEIVSVAVNLAQQQPLVGETTMAKRVIGADQLKGYNTTIASTSQDGLTSYSADDISVTYDTNADDFGVYDTVTVNDTILVEEGYFTDDDEENLNLNEIYTDYYEVEVDYNSNGQVEGLYYYDRYYTYHYDANSNLTEIYLDGEKYKSFTYNGNGNIIKEEIQTAESSFTNEYSYGEDGKLYSVNGSQVYAANTTHNDVSIGEKTFSWDGRSVSLTYGEKVAQFLYDYTFNGDSFLTEKTVDGIITKYKYVGDKVVEINNNGNKLSYILDKDLNYIGLSYCGIKYYFAVDPYGNVMGLMDMYGNFVVEYQYDIFGTIDSISGELSSSLGLLNEIVNLNGLYDHTLNCYFFADNIYLPSDGITLHDNMVYYAKCIYQWEQSNYFARSAVSSFALIHDMVVDVAVKNLREQGVDVVSNLYATDENGDNKRLVDIYTLDYSLTPFSTKNLLQGNQIYEVIYHAPDSEKFFEIANAKLQDISDNWKVSYFAEYEPTAGKMTFHGQFIFLGYLIDYKCAENGIVEYQVKNNVKLNYDQTVNIFDYDNNKYVCYVNNTFDLDFLDGVTIIPGISQEQYEALDGYLSDYMQSVAGNVCDQMLIYDDPNYYDLEKMNVTPDYWAQMNLEDSTTYLEIQADGSVDVKTMPVWETDGFATKLLIGAGVVLVTAVVATVAISIPGANCVVVSICVGAAKGAAIGAASGFAMGFVEPLVGIAIEGVATGNWDFSNYFNDALSAAADGFVSGAITGAILGGIQGGLNPTYCFEAGTPIATANGSVAIENIAVGDMVWSYDYKTGEKALKPIAAITVRETNQIVKINIRGEQIITTPEHPFYVVDDDLYEGYVAAKYLTTGDCILTANGNYLKVFSIWQENLDEPITVYNLSVNDNHSYYVGENELLVHNITCNEVNNYYADTQNRQFETYKDFKKQYGRAGDGYEWHHIVEQSQVKNGTVAAQKVYSVENTIRLDYANHRKISAFYTSTKQDFTGGLSVRQWLSQFSYEEQYEYGRMFLEQICGIVI